MGTYLLEIFWEFTCRISLLLLVEVISPYETILPYLYLDFWHEWVVDFIFFFMFRSIWSKQRNLAWQLLIFNTKGWQLTLMLSPENFFKWYCDMMLLDDLTIQDTFGHLLYELVWWSWLVLFQFDWLSMTIG